MSTIHFYVGSETGEYIFFDNEIDMYEYAMKHNLDIDSTDCLVYDHAEMGLEKLTREDIEHGGIDYSQEGETLLDYINRRPDAETDYLDMIVKLKKDLDKSEFKFKIETQQRDIYIKEMTDTIKKLEKDIDDLKTQLIKVPKKSMNYGYMKNLEKENKKFNKIIESVQEWIDLHKNENGLITNYELRQVDWRIKPEDYEPGI